MLPVVTEDTLSVQFPQPRVLSVVLHNSEPSFAATPPGKQCIRDCALGLGLSLLYSKWGKENGIGGLLQLPLPLGFDFGYMCCNMAKAQSRLLVEGPPTNTKRFAFHSQM